MRHFACIKLIIRKWNTKKNKPKESVLLILNAGILYKSKNTILGLVQTDHFSEEHHNLNSGKSLSKFSNIWPLAPILVNNLVKVGGRIQHSNIQDQQKHKKHLPAAHHVK